MLCPGVERAIEQSHKPTQKIGIMIMIIINNKERREIYIERGRVMERKIEIDRDRWIERGGGESWRTKSG